MFYICTRPTNSSYHCSECIIWRRWIRWLPTTSTSWPSFRCRPRSSLSPPL